MAEPLARLRWPDEAPAPSTLDAARAALDGGGLLALPTEAGYVVAAVHDRGDAVERLPAGRRVEAVGPGALAQSRYPHLLGRLAERYWPGPLALAIGGPDDDTRTVQATSHRATAALAASLARDGRRLLWVQARDAEGSPLADPGAVEATLGPLLVGVADGGPTRLAEAPALLAVGPDRFELLEAGLLPIEDLRATAGLGILFVCTGNTCRSPMASALARSLIAERLETASIDRFGFQVASAGVFASHGAAASGHAVTAVEEYGAALEGHRSQPATPELVAAAKRVFCLTRSHLEALRLALPPGRADHVALLDPDGRDVADPVGGTLEDYRRCARQIVAAVRARSVDWV